MTKHRPWWSDRVRRAAAFLICSLLLAPPALGALGKAAATRPAKPSLPKKTTSLATDVYVAEVEDGADFGLRGQASFYGSGFQGRKTSTGERFDVRQFTAASNHFPLGTRVAVQRLDDARCAIVKVNDRMHAKHRKRVIDVSRGVAEYLGMIRAGVVLVRVARLKSGNPDQAACASAFESEGENCTDCELPPVTPSLPTIFTD